MNMRQVCDQLVPNHFGGAKRRSQFLLCGLLQRANEGVSEHCQISFAVLGNHGCRGAEARGLAEN
jgi:hypothetical protein